jgi:hypothetical protein
MGIIDSIKNNSLVKKIYWKLEKLTIYSYSNVARTENKKQFEVMFNPDSYSLSYENIYSGYQALNTSGRVSKYILSKPSNLSLKLIFDGTGVSEFSLPLSETYFDPVFELRRPWANTQTVTQRIDEFVKLTAVMDGDLHQPRFLKVEWGTMIYKCRLKNYTVKYTLFDKGGDPLRAEIDVVFFYETDDAERLRRENKHSPDLTHKRIVKSHDTLPLLCQEVYGSSRYYLEVARANKLVDFRNLVVGQEIYFPPIEE